MDDRHAFLTADTVLGFARFMPRFVVNQYLHPQSTNPGAGRGRPPAPRGRALPLPGQQLRRAGAPTMPGGGFSSLLASGAEGCQCTCPTCKPRAVKIGIAMRKRRDPAQAQMASTSPSSANFIPLDDDVGDPDPDPDSDYEADYCVDTCGCDCATEGPRSQELQWDGGTAASSRVPLDRACGGETEAAMMRLRIHGFGGGDALNSDVSGFYNEVVQLITSAGGDILSFRGNVIDVIWISDDEPLAALAVRAVRSATEVATRAHRLFGMGEGTTSLSLSTAPRTAGGSHPDSSAFLSSGTPASSPLKNERSRRLLRKTSSGLDDSSLRVPSRPRTKGLHVTVGVGSGKIFIAELGGGDPVRPTHPTTQTEEDTPELPSGLNYDARWVTVASGAAAIRSGIAEKLCGELQSEWDRSSSSKFANSVVICQYTAKMLRDRQALSTQFASPNLDEPTEFAVISSLRSSRARGKVEYIRLGTCMWYRGSAPENATVSDRLASSAGILESGTRPVVIASSRGNKTSERMGRVFLEDSPSRSSNELHIGIERLRADRVGLLGMALCPFVPRATTRMLHKSFLNGQLDRVKTGAMTQHTSVAAALASSAAAARALANRQDAMHSGRSRLTALASLWSASGYAHVLILEIRIEGLEVTSTTLPIIHDMIRRLQEVTAPRGGVLQVIWSDAGGLRLRFVCENLHAPAMESTRELNALLATEQAYEIISRSLWPLLERHKIAPDETTLRLYFSIVSRRNFSGLFGSDSRCDYTVHGPAIALSDAFLHISEEYVKVRPNFTWKTWLPCVTIVDEPTAAILRQQSVCELTPVLAKLDLPTYAPCSLKTVRNELDEVGYVEGWIAGGSPKKRPDERIANRLVGRESELAILERTITALCDGSGDCSFLAIEGIEGSGKSRLLLEAERLCSDRAGKSATPGPLFLQTEARTRTVGSFFAWWPIVAKLLQLPPYIYEPSGTFVEGPSWTEGNLTKHLQSCFQSAPSLLPYVDWLRAALPPLPLVVANDGGLQPQPWPHSSVQLSPQVTSKINELVIHLLRLATQEVTDNGDHIFRPVLIAIEHVPLLDNASWSLVLAAAMTVPGLLFVATAQTYAYNFLESTPADDESWKPREYAKVFQMLNHSANSSGEGPGTQKAIRIGPLRPLDDTASIARNTFEEYRQSASNSDALWPISWDPEVGREISAKAQGSPLVAIELARALLDAATLRLSSSSVVESGGNRTRADSVSIHQLARADPIGFIRRYLPSSVSTLVMRRIQELAPTHKLVLMILSGCGESASLRVLAQVMPNGTAEDEEVDGNDVRRSRTADLAAGQSLPELRTWLIDLVKAGFLEIVSSSGTGENQLSNPIDVVKFRHALGRQTAYSMLLPSQRTALHTRLVRALDTELRVLRDDSADSSRQQLGWKDRRIRVTPSQHITTMQAYHLLHMDLSAEENFVRAVVASVRVAHGARSRLSAKEATQWLGQLLGVLDLIAKQTCGRVGANASQLSQDYVRELRERGTAASCAQLSNAACRILPGELVFFDHDFPTVLTVASSDTSSRFGASPLSETQLAGGEDFVLGVSHQTRALWQRQLGDICVRTGKIDHAISHLNDVFVTLGERPVSAELCASSGESLSKSFLASSWKNFLLPPSGREEGDFPMPDQFTTVQFVRISVESHDPNFTRPNIHNVSVTPDARIDSLRHDESPPVGNWSPAVRTGFLVKVYELISEAYFLAGNMACSAYAAMKSFKLYSNLPDAPVFAKIMANMGALGLFMAGSTSWSISYAERAERLSEKFGHFPTTCYVAIVNTISRCAMGEWSKVEKSLSSIQNIIEPDSVLTPPKGAYLPTWRDELLYHWAWGVFTCFSGRFVEANAHLRRATSRTVFLDAGANDRKTIRQSSTGFGDDDLFVMASLYMEVYACLHLGQKGEANETYLEMLDPFVSHSLPEHLRGSADGPRADEPSVVLDATIKHWNRPIDEQLTFEELTDAVAKLGAVISDLRTHVKMHIPLLTVVVPAELVGCAVMTLWRDILHCVFQLSSDDERSGKAQVLVIRIQALSESVEALFREVSAAMPVFEARYRIQQAMGRLLDAFTADITLSSSRSLRLRTRSIQLFQLASKAADKRNLPYEKAVANYLASLILPRTVLSPKKQTIFGRSDSESSGLNFVRRSLFGRGSSDVEAKKPSGKSPPASPKQLRVGENVGGRFGGQKTLRPIIALPESSELRDAGVKCDAALHVETVRGLLRFPGLP